MRSYALILAVVMLFGACAREPTTTAELQRLGPDNVAIDGYSPVSYFERDKAEKGSPEFVVLHEGVTYWLTDAVQAEKFAAEPQRYAPAHGGWCSLMLTGSGNLVVANPRSFKIVDDRLLLFWSGDFQGQPIDGLRNWESKFGDAGEERELLGRADRAWQELLSGSKKEKVVFFNPRDAERVNDARRAVGEKTYE